MSESGNRFKTIGIAGAGTMGRGIAQLCLQEGYRVILYDVKMAAVIQAAEIIESNLKQAAAKGKIAGARAQNIAQRLSCASRTEHFQDADFIIETIIEDLKSKQELLLELSGYARPDVMMATNTSSLSVQAIAKALPEPGRLAGMHFFNPPYVMKLVEIIEAPTTSVQAFRAAWELALTLCRIPIRAKDTPGFIVNRVLRPLYLEAMNLVMAGQACIPSVDEACKKEGGLPMGPFELMDFIGLDVNLAVSKSIYDALGKPERLKPSLMQQHLVALGQLGRKTGSGFYIYREGKMTEENPEVLSLAAKGKDGMSAAEIWRRIMSAIFEEARLLAQSRTAEESDIDTAVKLGANFPQGPFEWQNTQR